jgi:hypothetical protein
MAAVFDIDVTAARVFTEVLRQLAESGVDLWVSTVRDRTWTGMVSALDATGVAQPRRFAANEAALQEALGQDDV